MEPWGFSDMINNCGKGDGQAAYLQQPAGPKDPYYAYLDSLAPPQGRICADDLAYRYAIRDERLWGATEPCPLDDEHYCDNWIARNGLELLDRSPHDKPWYLAVNFDGPHPPMDITRSMQGRFRGPERVIDGFRQPVDYQGPFPAEQHLRIRQNYAAMIENVDRWLGVYIERLRERGELDNTLIIYSSDHGEMLGDHGRWGKSVPYQPSAGVPLICSGPGVAQGARCNALSSMIDVTATFLDFGDTAPAPDMQGASLRALLESPAAEHHDHVRSALGNWRFVQDRRYKLIEGFGDDTLLVDREKDPWELENVAARMPSVVEQLRRRFV
jgi:arylsulfatase A-like enzyme